MKLRSMHTLPGLSPPRSSPRHGCGTTVHSFSSCGCSLQTLVNYRFAAAGSPLQQYVSAVVSSYRQRFYHATGRYRYLHRHHYCNSSTVCTIFRLAFPARIENLNHVVFFGTHVTFVLYVCSFLPSKIKHRVLYCIPIQNDVVQIIARLLWDGRMLREAFSHVEYFTSIYLCKFICCWGAYVDLTSLHITTL